MNLVKFEKSRIIKSQRYGIKKSISEFVLKYFEKLEYNINIIKNTIQYE